MSTFKCSTEMILQTIRTFLFFFLLHPKDSLSNTILSYLKLKNIIHFNNYYSQRQKACIYINLRRINPSQHTRCFPNFFGFHLHAPFVSFCFLPDSLRNFPIHIYVCTPPFTTPKLPSSSKPHLNCQSVSLNSAVQQSETANSSLVFYPLSQPPSCRNSARQQDLNSLS